eukprot:TRINITY_DN14468_c1_g1_i4.p1 TRINITY_DN14468_c1_g1~~TRINITY_DN14468_c1_g1_i4.p1  ORF type:complete len:1247 (+),score=232.36 TRINITY_DN14468_c1_g1_i4:553-3741(+)
MTASIVTQQNGAAVTINAAKAGESTGDVVDVEAKARRPSEVGDADADAAKLGGGLPKEAGRINATSMAIKIAEAVAAQKARTEVTSDETVTRAAAETSNEGSSEDVQGAVRETERANTMARESVKMTTSGEALTISTDTTTSETTTSETTTISTVTRTTFTTSRTTSTVTFTYTTSEKPVKGELMMVVRQADNFVTEPAASVTVQKVIATAFNVTTNQVSVAIHCEKGCSEAVKVKNDAQFARMIPHETRLSRTQAVDALVAANKIGPPQNQSEPVDIVPIGQAAMTAASNTAASNTSEVVDAMSAASTWKMPSRSVDTSPFSLFAIGLADNGGQMHVTMPETSEAYSSDNVGGVDDTPMQWSERMPPPDVPTELPLGFVQGSTTSPAQAYSPSMPGNAADPAMIAEAMFPGYGISKGTPSATLPPLYVPTSSQVPPLAIAAVPPEPLPDLGVVLLAYEINVISAGIDRVQLIQNVRTYPVELLVQAIYVEYPQCAVGSNWSSKGWSASAPAVKPTASPAPPPEPPKSKPAEIAMAPPPETDSLLQQDSWMPLLDQSRRTKRTGDRLLRSAPILQPVPSLESQARTFWPPNNGETKGIVEGPMTAFSVSPNANMGTLEVAKISGSGVGSNSGQHSATNGKITQPGMTPSLFAISAGQNAAKAAIRSKKTIQDVVTAAASAAKEAEGSRSDIARAAACGAIFAAMANGASWREALPLSISAAKDAGCPPSAMGRVVGLSAAEFFRKADRPVEMVAMGAGQAAKAAGASPAIASAVAAEAVTSVALDSKLSRKQVIEAASDAATQAGGSSSDVARASGTAAARVAAALDMRPAEQVKAAVFIVMEKNGTILDAVHVAAVAAAESAGVVGLSTAEAVQAAKLAVHLSGGKPEDVVQGAAVAVATSAILRGLSTEHVAHKAAEAAKQAGGTPVDITWAASDAAAASTRTRGDSFADAAYAVSGALQVLGLPQGGSMPVIHGLVAANFALDTGSSEYEVAKAAADAAKAAHGTTPEVTVAARIAADEWIRRSVSKTRPQPEHGALHKLFKALRQLRQRFSEALSWQE